MSSNIYSGYRVCCLLVVLLTVSHVSIKAQDKGFTTWANLGFEHKLKSDFAINAGLEWRTKDDLARTDRWGMNVGGSYTLLPFLKLGAGYEVHYRNRGDQGWKFRHRYSFDGTLSTRLQNIKLSLRERFQHTIDGGSDEFRLRSRMKAAYAIPKCILEPYVSIEMYNSLNRCDHFGVKRMRYRGGIELPLSDRWSADVFYCRQWESDKQKNIVGVECSFAF